MAENFIRVKCPDCGSEQIIFKKAATKVVCTACGATIAVPKGGDAEIKGEVVGEAE